MYCVADLRVDIQIYRIINFLRRMALFRRSVIDIMLNKIWYYKKKRVFHRMLTLRILEIDIKNPAFISGLGLVSGISKIIHAKNFIMLIILTMFGQLKNILSGANTLGCLQISHLAETFFATTKSHEETKSNTICYYFLLKIGELDFY
uniref:Uncharacterized protein n=1 Tax=Rhizophagus irregularis (strain DAOM 181602 / DAOM 197198 / MUCL 43194) TaxID=747089 RepID=U9SG61_RHIID